MTVREEPGTFRHEDRAERGNRIVTLDLRGHGRSDRPPDMWRYGMGFFAQDVVALLDHLGDDEAIVGGTSLGANTTLEVASLAPDRLRGMVIEMPVLDNVLLDTVRQEPAGSAAVLQGIFAGRTAPHRIERRTFTAPALVIGHHRDPVPQSGRVGARRARKAPLPYPPPWPVVRRRKKLVAESGSSANARRRLPPPGASACSSWPAACSPSWPSP